MKDESHKAKIILLGSTGFLGSQLHSNLVSQGYLVELADRSLTFLERKEPRSKLDGRKTLVISMAWSSNRRSDYLNNPENAIWTQKHIEIAQYCIKHDYFLVVPGSCLEYGDNESNEYVKSKIQLRKFLEENMPTDKYMWLRYFYVFSLANRRPGLIREALEARSQFKQFNADNIKSRHDYIEVRDAIRQTTELINGLNYGVWDIGTGTTRSNLDLLSRIKNLNFIEKVNVESTNRPRIVWEGSAKKLILNHTQFTSHTSEFFGTLES